MKPLKLLFVCRHNRCRSVFAEAIANQLAEGRILARSVGMEPTGEVHPATIRYLAEKGYATDGLRSESWDALADFQPDIVITVADDYVDATLPTDGRAERVHWGLRDPCVLNGDFALQEATFGAIVATLERRVRCLLLQLADDRWQCSPSNPRTTRTLVGAFA
jgi:arsenate reductase (thioredoxin)